MDEQIYPLVFEFTLFVTFIKLDIAAIIPKTREIPQSEIEPELWHVPLVLLFNSIMLFCSDWITLLRNKSILAALKENDDKASIEFSL